MAEKKVNLRISLKDGVSTGLQKIGAGMKKVAIACAAMKVVVIAAMAKMGKVFMVQQDAQNALASSFDNLGMKGSALLPVFEAFATAMQKVTKYGDEAILSAMAYGSNLGITIDKLQSATRAAAGLAAKYKIDLTTAMMLVGRASSGQTQMLTRYGIVLDETLTKEQKFDELLKIGGSAFDLATKETDTLSGAWQQFKNILGDAQENIFKAITGGDDLTVTIKNLTKAVTDLVESGDLVVWGEKVGNAFKVVADTIGPIYKFIKSTLEASAAGVRAIGGFIGGTVGETQSQSLSERTSLSGLKKQWEAGKRGALESHEVVMKEQEAARASFKFNKETDEKLSAIAFEKEKENQKKILAEKAREEAKALNKKVQAELKARLLSVSSTDYELKAATRKAEIEKATTDDQRALLKEIYAAEDAKLANAKAIANITNPPEEKAKSGMSVGVPLYGQPGQKLSKIEAARMRSLSAEMDEINRTGNKAAVASFMGRLNWAKKSMAQKGMSGTNWEQMAVEMSKGGTTRELEKTNATLDDIYGVLNDRLGGVS